MSKYPTQKLGVLDGSKASKLWFNQMLVEKINENKNFDIWDFQPVSPKIFVTNKYYLGLKKIARKCHIDDMCELFGDDPLHPKFTEAVFIEAIGAGKSFKLSLIECYFTYILLCLKDPASYFKLAPLSKIALINMCFAGRNKIRLADGSLKTVEDLYKLGVKPKITAWDGENFISVKADIVRQTGKGRRIYEIFFNDGSVLYLTDNHPLYKLGPRKFRGPRNGEWIELKRIKEGDSVLRGWWAPDRQESVLEDAELKIIAYMIGDDDFRDSVKKIGGKTRISPKNYGKSKKTKLVYCSGGGGANQFTGAKNPVRSLLNRFFGKQRAYQRYIPDEILCSSERQLCLFLSRLWATNGYLGKNFTYTTTSENLAIDIKDALASLGIFSRIYSSMASYRGKIGHRFWRIHVCGGYEKQLFLEKIGKFGIDFIQDWKTVPKRSGKTGWIKVKSIKYIGREDVYDLEVPKYHNLLVDGIVVHNSVNKTNANKVVFGEIGNKILFSPWFQEHYPPNPKVKSELQFDVPPDNEKEREEALREGTIFKNIYIIPGSSTANVAVGYNIILGAMDEAALMRETNKMDYGDEIFTALQRRVTSRFMDEETGGHHGMVVVASSPVYTGDFTEKKYLEAQGRKDILAKRRPLWDAKLPNWRGPWFYFDTSDLRILDDEEVVNRRLRESLGWEAEIPGVLKVPDTHDLRRDFIIKPAKALRDHGAQPTDALHPFVENPRLVEDLANPERENPQKINGGMKEWFSPIVEWSHALHVDLSLNRDACGLAMGHIHYFDEKEEPYIWMDLMMQIKPADVGGRIRLARIREMIKEFDVLGFVLGSITYDGFQSEDSIQLLEAQGFPAANLSADKTMAPYTDLKEVLLEGRLNYYKHPVFIREFQQVEEDSKSRKIDHPPRGSKDVSDAVACVVHTLCKNPAWCENSMSTDAIIKVV